MENKKISEYIVRFTGTACLMEAINHELEYTFTIKGFVKSIEERNNEDGTYNLVYKIGIQYVETVDKSGKMIKMKDKRTPSQKLRNFLWIIYSEQGITEEFDEWYPKAMAVLLDKAELTLLQANLIKSKL